MTSRATPQRSASSRRSPVVAVLVALGLVLAVVAALVSTSRGGGDDAPAVSYDRESQVLDFRAATFAGQEVDSAELRGTPLVPIPFN